MLDRIVEKFAGYIAKRVAEELVKRLPDVLGAAVEVLPDVYEALADKIIERLTSRLSPFSPFRR